MSKYWIIGIIIFTIEVYNQKGTVTIIAIIVAIGLYNYFEEKPFKIENFQSDENYLNTKAENYLNDRYVGQDINLVLKDFEASGLKCTESKMTKYDLLGTKSYKKEGGKRYEKRFGCKYTTNTISLHPFYNYGVGVLINGNVVVDIIVTRKFIIGK